MRREKDVEIVLGNRIKSIKKVGKADVYNIQMKNNHNYFANDILVSNCDCIRYIVNTRIKSDATWIRSSNKEVDINELCEQAQEQLCKPKTAYAQEVERPTNTFSNF